MATNPDRDTEQRVYDSEFLKFLARPPEPLVPQLPPRLRRVAVEPTSSPFAWREIATPQLTTLQRMSSVFKRKIPVAKPTPASYEVTLDVSRQVLRLKVPKEIEWDARQEAVEARLFPSFAEAPVDVLKFAPAAALALKAKQFDDGLYATVEMAADSGLGRFPAKNDFLLRLLQALTTDGDQAAASILTAAARLRGQAPQVSDEVAWQAEALQREFLADELRSKVLGFYTWSEELSRIFRRDRMLQAEIKEPAARAFATALSRNSDLLTAYDSHLRLAEKLTNPLAWNDLRELAVALKEGRGPIFPKRMSLYPPSRAYETDLVTELYGNRPIPDGFNLAEEMMKRVRSGEIDLTPKPTSGWYDHQTHALEALVVPERMPEGNHLSFDESYRMELAGLFKALLALTRETHIKQLEATMVGAALPARESKELLCISPGLTLEPLPTYYLRRSRSYCFVNEVLEQAFGEQGLDEMRRMTADGPVNLSLGEELRLMRALFRGAYLEACRELGMTPEANPGIGESDANSDRATLGAWLASVRKDPDLGNDVRMMVPIFYDVVRKKTKVWVVLGVATKPLTVSYATPPVIKQITGPDGQLLKPDDVEVEFTADFHQTAYFATAELYVTRLLDRKEFRGHCDRHKTYEAIISRLN